MTNEKDKKQKKRSDIKPKFIISPLPQLPEKKISEVQEIQLDIIAKTNFNFFNGRKITQWLRESQDVAGRVIATGSALTPRYG